MSGLQFIQRKWHIHSGQIEKKKIVMLFTFLCISRDEVDHFPAFYFEKYQTQKHS